MRSPTDFRRVQADRKRVRLQPTLRLPAMRPLARSRESARQICRHRAEHSGLSIQIQWHPIGLVNALVTFRDALMWIVRVALNRLYTFVVLALLILLVSPLVILRTPTDIFPNIGIPVVSVIWSYDGFPPREMSDRIGSTISSTWNPSPTTASASSSCFSGRL